MGTKVLGGSRIEGLDFFEFVILVQTLVGMIGHGNVTWEHLFLLLILADRLKLRF
ncbi:MAG: hypothetical protein SF028_07750 [Candidatus Sumerlaeia bacterium]|nr:hypothetical protein [Candidatus Sumerlaeia bacterium]